MIATNKKLQKVNLEEKDIQDDLQKVIDELKVEILALNESITDLRIES